MAFNKGYGLLLKKKAPATKALSRLKPKLNIFDDESSGDEMLVDTTKSVATTSRIRKETQVEMEKALLEDASVFQYDEVYDSIQQAREPEAPAASSGRGQRKSKYITGLMSAAKLREKENERRTERQVQKEREEEGDEFEGKEKFVTSAYRKKMEEQKAEEEKERREAAMEDMLDVRKQKDLGGFYRHLFKSETERFKPAVKEEPELKPDVSELESRISQPETNEAQSGTSEHSERNQGVSKRSYRPVSESSNSSESSSSSSESDDEIATRDSRQHSQSSRSAHSARSEADRPERSGSRDERRDDRPYRSGSRNERRDDRPYRSGSRDERRNDRPDRSGSRDEIRDDRPNRSGSRDERRDAGRTDEARAAPEKLRDRARDDGRSERREERRSDKNQRHGREDSHRRREDDLTKHKHQENREAHRENKKDKHRDRDDVSPRRENSIVGDETATVKHKEAHSGQKKQRTEGSVPSTASAAGTSAAPSEDENLKRKFARKTTEGETLDAKARYLARKLARKGAS